MDIYRWPAVGVERHELEDGLQDRRDRVAVSADLLGSGVAANGTGREIRIGQH